MQILWVFGAWLVSPTVPGLFSEAATEMFQARKDSTKTHQTLSFKQNMPKSGSVQNCGFPQYVLLVASEQDAYAMDRHGS